MNHSCQRIDILARDLSTARLDEQEKAVTDWLSPLQPSQTHHLAWAARQSGTLEWFRKSKEFQEWLEVRNTVLWLSGPPGSGKTVMMSHAIESVACTIAQLDDKAVYAFAYCDFRDPDSQNVTNILGAMLSQLCTQLRCFPDELLRAYQSSNTERNQGLFPTVEVISKAIEILSMKRRIYLLIDAIDEVGDSSWINVFITSRNNVSIQRALTNARRVSLEHHVSEIDHDISQYIADRLSSDPDLVWLSPDVQSGISDSLLSKSKGMFRWAVCQLDSLSRCRTVRDVKKSLKKLPQGLNKTYGRLLARLPPSDVQLVRKTMTWLAFSVIPITLNQLWEALAIERGSGCIDDESRLRSPQDILILGHSLITVSSDGHVMLAHLSVRDYLVSSEIKDDSGTAPFALQPGISHKDLAIDCLTYLFLSGLSTGPSKTQEEYSCRLKQLPLLNYATKYWFHHARNAEFSEDLDDLTMRFFSHQARPNFMAWVQAFNADATFKWDVFPRHATSLYYAASLGLDRVVESLLRLAMHNEIDAPGSRFGGTAIHAAIIRGHMIIVKLLIAAGADPGKADFNHVTPLHSAASQGSIDGIKVLLDHGAPTNIRDSMDGKTPADWARLSGHMAAARAIELNSEDLETQLDSQASGRADTTDGSSPEPESPMIQVWQPGVGYFPDYYERRSGLDSSLIIRITIGEVTSQFSGDFTPLQPLGQLDGSHPSW
ncbi:Fc.00g054700.m01.CDS01 [Cosmosporella sp. VM-42]